MSSKKRILVVGQHFWPESFRINDICDFFIEKNCEVDVLCGIPNYPKGKFFEGYSYFRNMNEVHNSVNIMRSFEIPRGNNSNLRIFLNYISFPLSSLLHIPRLLTKKYDKIFIYQLSPVMMSLAGILLGKLTRTETTMYVLDLWPENLFSVIKIKNRILRNIATSVSHWHYRQVDKLAVLSESMKARLIDITGISEDKIIVLPQACEKVYELEVHDEALAAKFKNGFNILFAGNISPAQSFNTVIEAAKNLRGAGIKDINWIIVGDGMSRKWLEAEVNKAGIQDKFFFEGFKPIEDIPKYTGVADLLIGCLVKSELLEATIPAKVMSYLASGKPMVLAMDGEVQELINNTIRSGLVSSSGNSMALSENIKYIRSLNREERIKMGERGKDYHFANFERNIIFEKLYKFIFS